MVNDDSGEIVAVMAFQHMWWCQLLLGTTTPHHHHQLVVVMVVVIPGGDKVFRMRETLMVLVIAD